MVREVLKETTQLLKEGKVASPVWEAEILLGDTLGLSRSELYLNYDCLLTASEKIFLKEKIKRRLQGAPLQYLTGRQPFRHLNLKVSPGVFISRPETEILVDFVLEEAKKRPTPITFLDLGTGTGAIALSLASELSQAFGYATDISLQALSVAQENARNYGLEKKITFAQSNLFESLPQNLKGKLDVIVSNPPYVPTLEISNLPVEVQFFEPREALDGGEDGLKIIRRIVEESPLFLKAGSLFAFEVGVGQASKTSEIITNSGNFEQIKIFKDYQGIERVILTTHQLK